MWWPMPVIPAIPEVVRGHPGQKVNDNPISTNKLGSGGSYVVIPATWEA
jgi:hypothetical protein